MKLLIIFVCTAMVGGAINFQTRNNIQNRYSLVIMTSMFIGWMNLTLLKIMPHITELEEGVAYILGGAAGSFLALIMHKHFISKEENK